MRIRINIKQYNTDIIKTLNCLGSQQTAYIQRYVYIPIKGV